MCSLVVLAFLAFGAFRYSAAVSGSGDAGLVPPAKLGLRNRSRCWPIRSWA